MITKVENCLLKFRKFRIKVDVKREELTKILVAELEKLFKANHRDWDYYLHRYRQLPSHYRHSHVNYSKAMENEQNASPDFFEESDEEMSLADRDDIKGKSIASR